MKWLRVNRNRKCPICDHADWCMLSPDGTAALCMRLAGGREHKLKDGAIGWIYKTGDVPTAPTRPPETAVELRMDWPAMLARWAMDTTAHALAELSASLGVTVESLKDLGAVWAPRHRAWAFPMMDGQRCYTGIRLRAVDGKKWSVRGSRQGLFIPNRLPVAGPLVICEGPTDTVAMLDLGFDAVGRPSCTGGDGDIRRLLDGQRRDVVIVADRDGPGQRGARQLAADLGRACKVITPPGLIKDAREWKRNGATRAVVWR